MSILEKIQILERGKYLKLENYLLTNDWKNADFETAKLLLKENLYLYKDGLEKISKETWFCINFLWKWYSKRKFSYDIQIDLLVEFIQTKNNGILDFKAFVHLAINEIGWVNQDFPQNYSRQTHYSNKPLTLEAAPIGYFPRWGINFLVTYDDYIIGPLWMAGANKYLMSRKYLNPKHLRLADYKITVLDYDIYGNLYILKSFVEIISNVKSETEQAIIKVLEDMSSNINTEYINQLENVENEPDNSLRLAQVRPEQFLFRKRLLKAYNNCCAVTGCNVIEVLDAAHIIPYYQSKNCFCFNGLILRADIHRLFDLNLIAFIPEPDYPKNPNGIKIRVSPELKNTEYAEFDNKILYYLPKNLKELPNKNYLEARAKECKWLNYFGSTN